MLTTQDKLRINLRVAQLTSRTVVALKAEQDRVGIVSRTGGLKRINVRYKKNDGLVNRISFKFKRYGVYLEKGAGRGHGGQRGSRWQNARGQEIRTNPASLGKMNTGRYRAREWFNPVIQNYTEQLVEQVGNELVDISFRNLRIR